MEHELGVVVGVKADRRPPVRTGLRIARALGEPVTVVHAWDCEPDVSGTVAPEVRQRAEEGAQHLVLAAVADAEAADAGLPDLDVRHATVRGSAADALVDASRRATAVVVGADGRRLRDRLRPRVTRAVVRRSGCPVVVVADDEAEPGDGPVVLVVAGDVPQAAARVAFDVAHHGRRRLRVALVEDRPAPREQAEALVQQWAAAWPAGRPRVGTLEDALAQEASFLVVGQPQAHGLLTGRPSVPDTVLAQAHGPVIVVPDGGPAGQTSVTPS